MDRNLIYLSFVQVPFVFVIYFENIKDPDKKKGDECQSVFGTKNVILNRLNRKCFSDHKHLLLISADGDTIQLLPHVTQ